MSSAHSKKGNAELHSAAIDKGSLVPPAQTLMRYPKLQTEAIKNRDRIYAHAIAGFFFFAYISEQ